MSWRLHTRMRQGSLMSPEGCQGRAVRSPRFLDDGEDESCAASTRTTTSSAGSMPRVACSSAVGTHRTRIRRGSREPSTWSWSANSTTRPRAVDADAEAVHVGADRPTTETLAEELEPRSWGRSDSDTILSGRTQPPSSPRRLLGSGPGVRARTRATSPLLPRNSRGGASFRPRGPGARPSRSA